MAAVDKRGEAVAVVGGLLSLSACVVLSILAIWTDSSAVWAVCFQSFGAIGIWLLTVIQLHQQRLVSEEKLELAAIERDRIERLGGAKTIFEEQDLDQMEKLAMGRRLRAIERFLVPILAILFAVFHIAAGASVFPWALQFPPIRAVGDAPVLHASVLLFFCAGIAFVCFMMSRYALGLSRIRQWSLLRPGGNYLFGTSAFCLAVALALLCVISGLPQVEVWVGRAIGIVMIWMGVETLINYVLDFYRPRVPGEEPRPFYDNRLLGMFSEPVGILRSVANTIDYQFGFKVSETWFYKLLGRAVLPLLLLQVVIILALTCIVVVPPGHQAVLLHLGQLRPTTAKAGIHFTWPWPIDTAAIIPVDRIQRMAIGYEEEQTTDEDSSRTQVILWTVKHYKKEYQLLVADRSASAADKVPINLLSLNMPVHWRVKHDDKEVIRFYSQSADAAQLIEAIAYRELTQYAAESDVLKLMGSGGVETSAELRRRIQAGCDAAGYDGGGLGVEIVMVGIGGVHPPSDEDVAKTYEQVVSAIETRDATIKGAEGDAATRRIESAGDQWKELYEAIRLEDDLRSRNDPGLAEQTAVVEEMLRKVIGGEARVRAATASKNAFARLFSQKSEAELFETRLATYRAAPEVYSLRNYLRMMEEGLRRVRKFVIALENPDSVVYDIDLRPPAEIDLLGAEQAAAEQKRAQ